MTIEGKLDAVEALIKDALSIHVDDVNRRDIQAIMGREAYLKLNVAFKKSRADGTFEQHRDRMHRLSGALLGDVFGISDVRRPVSDQEDV